MNVQHNLLISTTSKRTDLLESTWPFLTILITSMPFNVLLADLKDLKPSIGLIIRFMALWSCSTMLFKYLTCLNLTFSGNSRSYFSFSIAGGYAIFLSTEITRGTWLWSDLSAFFKNLLLQFCLLLGWA